LPWKTLEKQRKNKKGGKMVKPNDNAPAHDIGATTIIIGESKEFEKLPWEHAKEKIAFYAENYPDRIYSLRADYDPRTGFWVLYEEWRYTAEFGDLTHHFQDRKVHHIFSQHRVAGERAEAQNESDAIGG
jgi:hypothetical protein